MDSCTVGAAPLPLTPRTTTTATVPARNRLNTSRVLSKVRQWPKEFVCNEGGAFLEAGPHSASGTVIGSPDQRVGQAKTPCSSGTRRTRRARRAMFQMRSIVRTARVSFAALRLDGQDELLRAFKSVSSVALSCRSNMKVLFLVKHHHHPRRWDDG